MVTINKVMQYSLLVRSRTDITIHDMKWNIDLFQFLQGWVLVNRKNWCEAYVL